MNHRMRRTIALLVTGSLLVLLSGSRPAGQVTYEVVADLNTLTGYVPLGGLTKGTDGALYGTTSQGGTGNCGLIYRLAADNTLSVLHNFQQAQGCQPVGDLVLGPDGNLYGTTFQGGATGLGTVYKITHGGIFTLLHSFTGSGNGSGPYAGLILLPDGLLYGTTTTGGLVLFNGVNSITFRISSDGAFEKLQSALGSSAALALGSDGTLWGTLRAGGFVGHAGGVYIIYPIPDAMRGAVPLPYVVGPPAGCPCPVGFNPIGELVEGPDGNFYGTTSSDGPNTGDQGTVFRITPTGTLTTLHAFSPEPGTTNYSQGKAPWAGLTLGTDGKLYGTATAGGAGSNGGLFRLSLDGAFEWLHSFDGAFSGGNTEARLLEASPGVFYSVTAGGGIFKLTTAVNAAPVAANGSAATTEDSYVNGQLAATDANNDALTFSIVANGSLGRVTINDPATGAFTYTPGANVSGVDTFTFKANDGTSDSNTATITVTVTAVNDAPTAFADSVTTTEDTPRAIVLTAFDVESPTVTFSLAGAPTKGTAVLTNASTGAVTYTPSPNATGVDSFTFQATDGSLTSNLATVTVTITPVNDAPSAQSGVLVTTEGVAANGSMAAADADGDSVTFTILTPPGLGTAAITDPSAGSFLYTPNAGAVGYDTFAYRVTDSGGASSDGIQMIYIVANSPRWPGQTALASPGAGGVVANGASSDARVSANGRFVTFASMASNLVAGDTTGDLDVFVQDRVSGAVTRVSVASDGTQGNGVSGMPSISADGRFVAFESEASSLAPGGAFGVTGILVRDRQTGATTRVGLAAGGGPANADSRVPSISGDGRIVAFLSNASNLVSNDTNGVADIFVHDRGLGTTIRVSVATAGTQSNAASLAPSVSADGRYVAFESNATNLVAGDANGFRDVFVRDLATGTTTLVSRSSAGALGNNTSQMAEVSADGRYVVFMSVASNLVTGDNNNAPDVFIHDRASGQTDRVSLATGGGEINATSLDPSVSADGRYVTFRSFASNVVAGDVNGVADVFVHDRQSGETRRLSVASDGAQGSASSEAPAISGDGRFVAFGSSAGNLVGGDTNGAQDAFVAGGVLVTPLVQSVLAAGGTHTVDVSFAYPGTAWTATSNVAWLTVNSQSSATGNGTVTYSAATNSGVARSGTLTVALQVVTVSQGANSAPVAVDGSATTVEDTAVSGVLSATEPDGNPLVFSIATNGAKGTAVITDAATGAFTYTPNANANGTDTFTFSVNDGSGNSNVATMTVTISAVNDAPVANAGTISTFVSTPVSGTLTATDIDGPSLTFAIVTNGTKGTATVTNAATGAYTYVPAAGQSGVDTFTFRANDGTANSNTAVVTVTIAGNRLPTASNGVLTTDEDRSATGTLVGSDADGNPLTFSIVSGGTLGTVTITNASMGRFKYVPNPNANGQDSFTFRVSDGTGSSNVATVAVTIVAINDAPEALDGATSTTVNTPVNGQLGGVDVDAGDTLTFTVKGAARRGTVTVGADGSFTYTPRSGYVGTDSFTFRVSDGRAMSGTATITVTVR